ncbi:hypothetical protein [Paenibacillus sp. KR2-11]
MESIGKEAVKRRIQMNRQVKEGLRSMTHITLRTPLEESLSAGTAAIEAAGYTVEQVVNRLLRKNIIATAKKPPEGAVCTSGVPVP